MEPQKIEIDIKAVPKGRPRWDKRGFMYTPSKTRKYEKLLKNILTQQWFNKLGQKTLSKNNAIKLTISFEFTRPPSVKRKHHTVKSDLDNYLKSLLDCMNKIIFEDDSMIIEISAKKKYLDRDRITLEIEVVE